LEDEPPSISIFITEDSIPEARELDLDLLQRAAREMLLLIEHANSYDVGLKIVDGPTMAQLHHDYMQDPTETDVMSFDSDDLDLEQGYLGDVVACACVARREAEQREHTEQDELMFYILHGILHLLGYDDDTPIKRELMLAIQAKALLKVNRVIEL